MSLSQSKESVLFKLNERIHAEHAAEAERLARAGRQVPAEPAPLKPEQIEFPKWVYKGWKNSAKGRGHQEPAESKLVHSEEELEALGDGWSEEPPSPKSKGWSEKTEPKTELKK